MSTKVTQSMLVAAANKADDVGEGIAGQLTNLLYNIETQGGAAFRGSGGTSLQNTSIELGEQLKRLLTALNTMAVNVNASSADYGTSDAEIAREITEVGNAFVPGGGSVVQALNGA